MPLTLLLAILVKLLWRSGNIKIKISFWSKNGELKPITNFSDSIDIYFLKLQECIYVWKCCTLLLILKTTSLNIKKYSKILTCERLFGNNIIDWSGYRQYYVLHVIGAANLCNRYNYAVGSLEPPQVWSLICIKR